MFKCNECGTTVCEARLEAAYRKLRHIWPMVRFRGDDIYVLLYLLSSAKILVEGNLRVVFVVCGVTARSRVDGDALVGQISVNYGPGEMSLTSHLRSRESPILGFLQQSFPILELSKRGSPNAKEFASILGFDFLPQCSLPTVYRNNHPGTIGTAVDYRFRYYFRSYDAHETVAATGIELLGDSALGKLGHEFLVHLNELVARINPARRQLADDDEAALDVCCLILALFEQVRRAGVVHQFDACPWRPKLHHLLALALPDMVQDVSQLSYAFASDAAELIKADAVLNPKFKGSVGVGGADADIIVGKTIVDFKCTAKVDATKLRNAALQLLGYVLLDYDDEYSISELAVYLPRHRFSWRIPLWKFVLPPEAILGVLKGNSVPNTDVVPKQLRKLRKAFQKVVNSL